MLGKQLGLSCNVNLTACFALLSSIFMCGARAELLRIVRRD